MKALLKINELIKGLRKGFAGVFLGWMLLWTFASQAQQDISSVRFKASVDTQEIRIGEQFHLILQAVTDTDYEAFSWANVPDSFRHLRVVDRSPMDTLRKEGRRIYRQTYTLTGFDSGRWEIPEFQFHPLKIQDSTILSTFRTPSIPITVHSVEVDTSKAFRAIKEIRKVPFNLLDYKWYIGVGLVVLLLILYFVFFYKKKEKKLKKKRKPLEPPYQQATRMLKLLEEKGLWQKGEIKAYYSELTDILRLYIQRRYGINALEQTSDELLTKVKTVTRLNQQRSELKYILEMADLAKFAKLSPQPEEHEYCMRKAKKMVEWTKPAPEKEEEGKKKTSK